MSAFVIAKGGGGDGGWRSVSMAAALTTSARPSRVHPVMSPPVSAAVHHAVH